MVFLWARVCKGMSPTHLRTLPTQLVESIWLKAQISSELARILRPTFLSYLDRRKLLSQRFRLASIKSLVSGFRVVLLQTWYLMIFGQYLVILEMLVLPSLSAKNENEVTFRTRDQQDSCVSLKELNLQWALEYGLVCFVFRFCDSFIFFRLAWTSHLI